MGRPSKFTEYVEKLKKYFFRYRSIPSFEKVTELLGIQSKRTVHRFFQQCLEEGYLEKYDRQYLATEKLSGIPLFSAVPAGSPDSASDEKQGDININELLISNPNTTILLTAQGDSMIDAGIMSGDMMIVDTTQKGHEGDIVIGIVDNEYTVKYLYKDTHKNRYLKAANSQKNYPDIYADSELSIYGTVTGVVRKY